MSTEPHTLKLYIVLGDEVIAGGEQVKVAVIASDCASKE